MLKNLLFIFFVLHVLIVKAQNVFIADSGEATFYSYAPVENIKGTSKQVNSIMNVENGDMAFMIPIRSFHFVKALMEKHFNEKYMESDKFPQATFKGTINRKIDINSFGTIPVTAKGKMNIHGREQEVIEDGELMIFPDKIILKTEFYIVLKDYGVTIPRLLFNNIADSVDVKLRVIYLPYKKQEN